MFKNEYLKNAATLKLNYEKCTGCGMCLNVCPHQVFLLNEGKALIIDLNRCMECGACVKNCFFDAIEVKSGVGCYTAIIKGILTGTEPTCGCSDDSSGCC